tara:strand:- start:42 stop:470 length:429 start_codon:yes stop_codon:yes gene_type:complete
MIENEDDEEKTTDIGLFNYAVSYWRAAQALRGIKIEATHSKAVICFLYYHAVELFLKSYLRLHKASLRELRKWGHDVNILAKKCHRHGLEFDPHEEEVFDLIREDMMKARYLKTGYYQRAGFEALERTTKWLYEEIAIAMTE